MAKFRTRARAVDMLGRQQIAGVSTAISELFKNAHDAYADHAEVDYFRPDNLLVVRDDGVGMTKEEFENRWLVIGTESKYESDGKSAQTYRPKDKPERAILGEKGIGRLAIALLGSHVLVLTRAKRGHQLHDLVMCFIHWGLFRAPSLNLDEITIPVRTFSGGGLPSNDEVAKLVSDCRSHVERLQGKHTDYDFGEILEELDDFQVDPGNLQEFLGGLSLKDSAGTHFYIAPANEAIAAEIEADRQNQKKDFSKFLLGFCNSTFLDTAPPPITTAFRHRPSDVEAEDLIGPGEFFTTEELASTDHRIIGEIDEYGQFKGTVRVYEQEHVDHVISWKESEGKPTACGPFALEFGYLQGAQRESHLAPEDWARLAAKLDNIGGLYVYRDRIRILPYGNSDVDWLDVELRRTKGAGHYFFSYRRLFGAVCLTKTANGRLQEKAGREGFQQDKAYRQFKSILENLLIQLAADFFREDKVDQKYFQLRKGELEKLELARRRREKQATTKRRTLTSALDAFFQKATQGLPLVEVNELRAQVNHKMESAIKIVNPDEASASLLLAEREAHRRLTEIRESYHVAKPRGVGLSRQLQRDWDAYCEEQERLEQEVFSPFSTEVAESLGKMAAQARVYVDQRRRLEELILQLANDKRKAVRDEAGKLRRTASDTRTAAVRAARDAIRELQTTIAEVEADFSRKDFSAMSPHAVEEVRRDFELRIEGVGRKHTETLAKVRDMLAAIAENLEQGMDVSQIEVMEAMDKDIQGFREQADTDAELVQLGLAVAVINHEFEAAIKNIRRTLRELRSWANVNEDLGPLYQEIRNNFDHLDGHLNLFTPLQRRLYRNPISIKGSEIHHYVRALFDVRLKRHGVELTATSLFLSSEVRGYPSTLYPVFVNVIDNAIFWLRTVQGERKITLDADETAFLIRNNGPVIPPRDFEAIFEQGFSRKPSGRGLGLFISKKALRKENMDITVDPTGESRGVTFRIKWPHEQDITKDAH